jgi:hypothetical protein
MPVGEMVRLPPKTFYRDRFATDPLEGIAEVVAVDEYHGTIKVKLDGVDPFWVSRSAVLSLDKDIPGAGEGESDA